MLRTLPAIHELLNDMDHGRISKCAALSLPAVRSNSSIISHTCDMVDNQVSFQPSDKCHLNCEMDNRLPTVIAPFDRIIPKLITHVETGSPKLPAPGGKCVHMSGESCLAVELVNEALWKKFYNEGHEMVVTKPGRSMFPVLGFKVTGLTPDENYKLAVDFVFVDKFSYRYSSAHNRWRRSASDGVVGPRPAAPLHRRYSEHQLSPAVGETFTAETLSFDRLRISNHPSENKVHLPTMRKYKVQLVITKLHCAQCQSCTHRFDFPLTEFIAVSNYQNVKLKQLKIRYNPYAKVFREEWKKSVVIPRKLSSGNKSQATQESRTKLTEQRKEEVNAKKRKKEDNPAQPKSSTLKDCRNDSKDPPTSGTSSAVPTGYIDLSRAIYSAVQRQENEMVAPRLNHTTCSSSWQPTEPFADHRPSHSYPTTEYSLTHYSLPPPPPCATPDSYHENPAMGTCEVNTLVAYNNNYGHDAYFNCDYSGSYHGGSNFDDYQAVACDGSAWNIVRY